MFQWLRRKGDKTSKSSQTPQVNLIDDLRASSLTVKTFRTTPQLVNSAKQQVFSSRVFAFMQAALENSHPCKFSLGGDASMNARVVRQAQIEGYQICLNNLASLGVFEEPKKVSEPDWGTGKIE